MHSATEARRSITGMKEKVISWRANWPTFVEKHARTQNTPDKVRNQRQIPATRFPERRGKWTRGLTGNKAQGFGPSAP